MFRTWVQINFIQCEKNEIDPKPPQDQISINIKWIISTVCKKHTFQYPCNDRNSRDGSLPSLSFVGHASPHLLNSDPSHDQSGSLRQIISFLLHQCWDLNYESVNIKIFFFFLRRNKTKTWNFYLVSINTTRAKAVLRFRTRIRKILASWILISKKMRIHGSGSKG